MRIFHNGELKLLILNILTDKPANGYYIMRTVAERLNGRWRPSPGSIYPALLGLEDAGLITSSEKDNCKHYTITKAGSETLNNKSNVLNSSIKRVMKNVSAAPTLGDVLEEFATQHPYRSVRLEDRILNEIKVYLDTVDKSLARIIEKGDKNG